jgi:hypothetical protein
MSSEHYRAASLYEVEGDETAEGGPALPQVSASKAVLVLNCARALGVLADPDPSPPHEAALYGSALHEACDPSGNPAGAAAAYCGATGADYETTLTEVQQHAVQVLALVKRELIDQGWEPIAYEVSRAWSPSLDRVRDIVLDRETHTYAGLEVEHEIGGTVDLVLRKGHRTMVLDYKTGAFGAFHAPDAMPQLRVLGEMWDATDLAVLHCPRQQPAVLYCEPVRLDTDAFVVELRDAMARRGDGSLRPGAWCARCPAKPSCVAHAGDIIQSAAALVRSAGVAIQRENVTPGAMHLFLERFNRLAKLARESVRAAVEASETPIPRPDGKVLELVEESYESLSKKSVTDAYGPNEAYKLLEELRAAGAIKSGTRRRLKVRKD